MSDDATTSSTKLVNEKVGSMLTISSSVSTTLTDDEKAEIDAQYVMGYFDYFWSNFGFSHVYKKFIRPLILPKTIIAICYNVGYALGMFAMSKWWLPKICKHFDFEKFLEYNY